MRAAARLIALAVVLLPATVWAGFAETLPQGTWLLDMAYLRSELDSKWNNRGQRVPLIDEIKRYEPGAGSQGVLKPDAQATLNIMALQMMYGIFDAWSLGFGVPIMISTVVDPRFSWEEGDYQWGLGRSYSEEDFWVWAGSMGQPKPGRWEGNKGVLGDFQIASRWRFTDSFKSFRDAGVAMALLVGAVIPTGRQPDPEEVVTAGTTSWDFHSNGDLMFHVGVDKYFEKSLDGRLTLAVDVFHEIFLPKTYEAPVGSKNPLMLNFAPFTGKHYTIDGGDFTGYSLQADIVPIKGPALGTWLVKGDAAKAEALPPLLTLNLRYTYIHLMQSDWESDSKIWDWDREKEWRPGYKNMLWGQAVVSLLRVGLPLQPYVNYRNLTWIPSKNCRAPNVYGVGTRLLMKFW